MKTVLLIKEIYFEGFKDLGNFIAKRYVKIFAWLTFVMFFLVVYAFIYRVSTGFPFD